MCPYLTNTTNIETAGRHDLIIGYICCKILIGGKRILKF